MSLSSEGKAHGASWRWSSCNYPNGGNGRNGGNGSGFSGDLGTVPTLTVSWRERAWVWEFAPSCLPRIPTVPLGLVFGRSCDRSPAKFERAERTWVVADCVLITNDGFGTDRDP